MRKILVRWDSPDGTATVCAERVGEHQLLPSHLVLYNVQGMAESSFPAVTIDTLAIKREEISYMAEGNEEEKIETAEESQPIVVQEEKAQEAPISKPIQEEAENCVPTDSVEKQIAGERTENGANASNSVIHSSRAKRTRRARSRSTKI